MSDLRQAAEQALNALERGETKLRYGAITALKAALAEPVQEPSGWFESPHGDFRANPLFKQEFPSSLLAWRIPLFTAPPQRPFVGLTLEEVEDIIKSNVTITDQRLYEGVYAVAVDIEMALKNKNDGCEK